MDDETKADPVKRLVGVLKKQEKIGTGAHYFENLLADDARLTPEEKTFCEFALNILAIVPHACTVERVNKAHDYVCSKARAALGCKTAQKQLFVVVNEQLLYKADQALADRAKEAQREACTATETEAYSLEDAEAELSSLDQLQANDCLPAENQEEKSDDDEDDDEESEDEEECTAFDEFCTPDGFSGVDKPETLIEAASAKDYHVLVYYLDSEGDYETPGMWWLGKVVNFNEKRRKNFKLEWTSSLITLQGLELENYYDKDATPEPKAGDWAYLKWNRAGGRKRARDDDTDDDVEMA